MHKEGKLDKEFCVYFAPTRPMFELFDTAADPHEMQSCGQEKTLALERV